MLKDRVLTEDCLQNTFVKIWLHRHCYDSLKAGLFTWMLNIAHYEAIDCLRSTQYANARLTIPLSGRESIATKNPLLRMDLLDLHKLLFILKPSERVILELCYFRGFSCQEISKLLSLPLGTVKTRMQQSYRKLRMSMT